MADCHDLCARSLLSTMPQIVQRMRREMRLRRGPSLSVPHFRTLAFIHHNPRASLSMAAEHVGLTLPAMSKTVDGLVARGLVARQVSAEDRRKMTLELTAAGQRAYASAHRAAEAVFAELLAPLSVGECRAVAAALEVLRPLFATAGDK